MSAANPVYTCLLLLLLLFSFSEATAQKVQFLTRSCKITEVEKGKIREMAVHEAAFFAEVFGPKKLMPLRIIIYGNRLEFYTVCMREKVALRRPQGFYSHRTRTMYVLKSDNLVRTCFHEMVHAIYHNYNNKVPTWLNEGIAECFERAHIDSTGKIQVMVNRSDCKKVINYLEKPEKAINSCLRKSGRRFYEYQAHKNYKISWAMAGFLYHNHKDILFKLMQETVTRRKSILLINEYYEGGTSRFAADVKNWCVQQAGAG
ncbi:MAG: DUF1570 domain-containing protein [Bacteroidia bacterium]|jgi:hypothetical protein|nr:DUF1570 domain-containing protein [Bacteroidia bacterium]